MYLPTVFVFIVIYDRFINIDMAGSKLVASLIDHYHADVSGVY